MLKYILDEATWVTEGIMCSDPATAKKVHKFLREAILDRHIYLNKVIGFAISGDVGPQLYSGTHITRHTNMGDSYPELYVVYSDKVFLNTVSSVTMFLQVGANSMSNLSKGALVPFEVLYVNDYGGRALSKEVKITLKLLYGSKYRSMADNSKVLGDEYFPCNTDFSIQPFVRIPPLPMNYTGNLVPVRLYNNMQWEQLRSILSSWLIYYRSGNLESEEAQWMRSFEH